MKPIKLHKNTINIPFEDDEGNVKVELHFDKGDDNVKRLYATFEEVTDRINGFDEDNTKEGLDNAKALVEQSLDSIFGPGSFEKLYKLNPSIYIIGQYFIQMAIGIKEELELEDLKAIEGKYLD